MGQQQKQKSVRTRNKDQLSSLFLRYSKNRSECYRGLVIVNSSLNSKKNCRATQKLDNSTLLKLAFFAGRTESLVTSVLGHCSKCL